MTVTRILLPALIATVAIIGLVSVVPIFLREMLYHTRRTREIDAWLEDLT